MSTEHYVLAVSREEAKEGRTRDGTPLLKIPTLGEAQERMNVWGHGTSLRIWRVREHRYVHPVGVRS